MAQGIGIASVNGGEDSKNDSFGLIGLCSIGPILSVLLLSLFYRDGSTDYLINKESLSLIEYVLEYSKEIAIALSPIVILFFLFQVLLH